MIYCLTGNHGRNKGNLNGDLKKNFIVTLQNIGLYSNLPHKILPKKRIKPSMVLTRVVVEKPGNYSRNMQMNQMGT